MSLREELAARLIRVGEDAHPNLIRSEAAGAMADECIRQMEWARRTGVELVLSEDRHYLPEISSAHKPLTVAPEGWKP